MDTLATGMGLRLRLRATILTIWASLLLLLAVPSAIRALVPSGPDLFSRQFFEDLRPPLKCGAFAIHRAACGGPGLWQA